MILSIIIRTLKNSNTEEALEKIKETLIKTTHKLLYRKKEMNGKVWITDEILHLIEEKI